MIHPEASPDPHFRPSVAHLQACFLPTLPGAPPTSLAPTKCTSTFPCISPAPQPQPSGDSHQLPLHTCLLTCLLMEPSRAFSPTLSSESLPAVSPTPWLVSSCIFGIVTRPMPTTPTASWPVSLPTRLPICCILTCIFTCSHLHPICPSPAAPPGQFHLLPRLHSSWAGCAQEGAVGGRPGHASGEL